MCLHSSAALLPVGNMVHCLVKNYNSIGAIFHVKKLFNLCRGIIFFFPFACWMRSSNWMLSKPAKLYSPWLMRQRAGNDWFQRESLKHPMTLHLALRRFMRACVCQYVMRALCELIVHDCSSTNARGVFLMGAGDYILQLKSNHYIELIFKWIRLQFIPPQVVYLQKLYTGKWASSFKN